MFRAFIVWPISQKEEYTFYLPHVFVASIIYIYIYINEQANKHIHTDTLALTYPTSFSYTITPVRPFPHTKAQAQLLNHVDVAALGRSDLHRLNRLRGVVERHFSRLQSRCLQYEQRMLRAEERYRQSEEEREQMVELHKKREADLIRSSKVIYIYACVFVEDGKMLC